MNQTSKTRILVVEDDRGSGRLLERILTTHGYEVTLSLTGEDGFDKVVRWKPHLLITDLLLPGMDGYTLVRQVRQRSETHTLPVLMLTSLSDRSSKIEGFEAGADDYLNKPFEPDDLIYRVKSLLARAEARAQPGLALGQRSRVIVFFSGKGGVGKTTIAANLAIALYQQTRKRVILFDADFSFGDVGVHLNLPNQPNVFDLVPEGHNLDVEVVRQVLLPHPSGIFVLLGPPRPQQGEQITAAMIGQLLPLLAELGDFIVIDGQPAYDERMLLLLERADDIMLVVTPEVGPIRNTSLFLDLAEMLDLPRHRIHILLNRADSRVGIESTDIERILKHPIEHHIMSGGRGVVLSVNQGVPLIFTHAEHPLSRQITLIAQQLTGVRVRT